MEQTAAGLNTVPALGEQLLLVETSGAGVAVHLAAEGTDAEVRAAVPAAWFRPDTTGYVPSIESYDRPALQATRWSPLTLCGRKWMAMAAGDGGALYRDQPSQYAPTCRRCLTIMDRRFPPSSPDDRLGSIAEMAARAVAQHGSAEIIGVPGDQLAPLRTELRRLFKNRFGHVGQTTHLNDFLLVTCDQATEAARSNARREAADRLDQADNAKPLDDPSSRIYWHSLDG